MPNNRRKTVPSLRKYLYENTTQEENRRLRKQIEEEYARRKKKTALDGLNAVADHFLSFGIGGEELKNKVNKGIKDTKKGLSDLYEYFTDTSGNGLLPPIGNLFAYGGTPMHYMTPEQTAFLSRRITEDSLNEAEASVAPLKAIGSLAINTGLNMMTNGLSKVDFGDSKFGNLLKDNADFIGGLGKIGISSIMANLAYGGTPESSLINYISDSDDCKCGCPGKPPCNDELFLPNVYDVKNKKEYDSLQPLIQPGTSTKLPKYNTRSDIKLTEDDYENSRKNLIDYLNSDKYKNRYVLQSYDVHEWNAYDKLFNARLNGLNEKELKNKYPEEYKTISKANKAAFNSLNKDLPNLIKKLNTKYKKPNISEEPLEIGPNYNPENKKLNLDYSVNDSLGLVGHEMSHLVDDYMGNLYGNLEAGEVAIQNSANEKMLDEHDSYPQEIKADIYGLRDILKNTGMYDDTKEIFTKDHLNQIQQNLKDDYLLKRLRKIITDDDLFIRMMNEVATNNNSNNNGIFVGAYGGNPNGQPQQNNPLMNMMNNLDEVDGTVPAEVEGNEVVQTPTGQLFDIKGPKHEQGGVPLQLPKAAEVYSDRIKIDGVSLADRKKKREKKTLKLEELLSLDKTDSLIRNTLDRTNQVNEQEEQTDKELQQFVGSILPQPKQEGKYAYGTGDNPFLPFKWFDYFGLGKNSPGVATPGITNGLSNFAFPVNSDLIPYAGYEKDFLKPSGLKIDNTYKPKTNNLNLGLFGNEMTDEDTLKYLDDLDKPVERDYQIIRDNVNIPNFFKRNPLDLSSLKELSDKIGTTDYPNGTNREVEKIPLGNKLLYELNGALKSLNENNPLSNATFGDALKIGGNLYQGIAPLKTTLEQRAGDLPNINHFENYGNEAKNTINKAIELLSSMKDDTTEDLTSFRNASINNNHQNVSSINLARVLNMATDLQTQEQLNKLDNNYNQTLLNLFGTKANIDMQSDATIMKGEYERDINDRRDRDAFYSQLNSDRLNLGSAISQTGADLNLLKERELNRILTNKLYENVGINKGFNDIDYSGSINPNVNVNTLNQNTTSGKYNIGDYKFDRSVLGSLDNKILSKIQSGEYELNKEGYLISRKDNTKVLNLKTGKETDIKNLRK